MKRLKTLLNQLYPASFQSWQKAVGISAFIILFLFLFQPFGIENIHFPYRLWVILGYGLITQFSLLFNQFIVPKLFPSVFKEEKWTVRMQILWLLWNVLLISSINFYYSSLIFQAPKNISFFLLFIFYTFLIAIFPITIITIISFNRILQNNIKKITQHNQSLPEKSSKEKIVKKDNDLMIYSANKKDSVSIATSYFLYIESVANYITIYWTDNGVIKEGTLRNTLKNIETQLENLPNICRTHKAFMVNLNQIIEMNGNAQGYKLTLKNVSTKIPVSRTYLKKFDAQMEQTH